MVKENYNKIIPHTINIALFVVTLILNLNIKIEPPVWIYYADPYDYLHQSEFSLTSKDFYISPKTDNFVPRPFTVPLFYKLAGSQPDNIIIMQKIMHSLATFIFCFIILLYLNKFTIKIIFIILFYLLMSWWNIVGWTNTLLSESLGISLLFLWLASFLLVFKKRTFVNLLIHIVLTILFSFTKDNWPYVIISFYTLYIIYSIIFKKQFLKYSLSLFVIGIVIFFVQQKFASISDRHQLPVINNIVFRILPYDDYYQWFIKKGMPCGELLKQNYTKLNSWKDIYPLYNDNNYEEFLLWTSKNGKSVYTKFLITHPDYLFRLLKDNPGDINSIFAYNIGYTGDIKGYYKFINNIFPIFNFISILILNILLLYLFSKRKGDIFIFPTILIIVFFINAILFYLADSLEIERHLFITNIMVQLIGLLLVIILLDFLLSNRELIKKYFYTMFRKSRIKHHFLNKHKSIL